MPTPSSNQPPEASSSLAFSTCPDDSQLSTHPEWNTGESGTRTRDRDTGMEVHEEIEMLREGDVIGNRVRRAVVQDAVVMDRVSPDSSSRDATTSPQPQSHSTVVTSPASSDPGRDTAKTIESLEDGPTRSPGTEARQLSSQNRTLESTDSPSDPASSSLGEDECSYSLHMGADYSSRRTRPTLPSSYLRPGSRFHGTQQSERQVYDVQVEIKHVDMSESFLCGYLRIQGLTEDHPTLTTYFEGEIIGSKHNFFTQHDDWGASPKVDLSHWSKFSAFRPYSKLARRGPVAISDVAQRDHIFMRWKEHFLVPDHRVRTITGASFEGFYYICFNQLKGEVSGIYFHSKSEKFQQLELKHVRDRGCFNAVEFR